MPDVALYEAYGLVFQSDLELSLPRSRRTRPDVSLERSPGLTSSAEFLHEDDPRIVASHEQANGRWYVALADEQGYRIHFRGCGEFAISADFAIIRWVETGDRADLLPILFTGTVLAFYLTMRRNLVLHASAVVRGRRALAFTGQEGRGKSTLAALTAAAGARIVTDDVLLVDTHNGTHRCRGSAGELRLRSGARPLAKSFADPVLSRETADQRLALWPKHVEADWVDLGAVVIPRPSRDATDLEVRRLASSDAVVRLLAFPRVKGLRPAAFLRLQLQLLSDLVGDTPVYDVVVPWGPPFAPGIASSLLDLADTLPSETPSPG